MESGIRSRWNTLHRVIEITYADIRLPTIPIDANITETMPSNT